MLFLKTYNFFIKIESHDSRFTALPGETMTNEVKIDVVFDKLIEDLVGHSMSACAKDGSLACVKTVFAREVAIGTGRFYQKSKGAHMTTTSCKVTQLCFFYPFVPENISHFFGEPQAEALGAGFEIGFSKIIVSRFWGTGKSSDKAHDGK